MHTEKTDCEKTQSSSTSVSSSVASCAVILYRLEVVSLCWKEAEVNEVCTRSDTVKTLVKITLEAFYWNVFGPGLLYLVLLNFQYFINAELGVNILLFHSITFRHVFFPAVIALRAHAKNKTGCQGKNYPIRYWKWPNAGTGRVFLAGNHVAKTLPALPRFDESFKTSTSIQPVWSLKLEKRQSLFMSLVMSTNKSRVNSTSRRLQREERKKKY